MKIFKSVGFYCDTQFALASVMCQSQVLKQDLLLCNDPFINEFVKDRNVTNIEDYARYALEHDPDFSSSNSTMPSK